MDTIKAAAYLLIPMVTVIILFYLYSTNFDPFNGHRLEAEVNRVAEQTELGVTDLVTVVQESIMEKAKDLLGLR